MGLGSALQSSLEGSPCPPAEQGIPLSSLQLWWGLQKTISFVTLPPRKSAVHPPQLLGICLVLGDSPEKANVGPLPQLRQHGKMGLEHLPPGGTIAGAAQA